MGKEKPEAATELSSLQPDRSVYQLHGFFKKIIKKPKSNQHQKPPNYRVWKGNHVCDQDLKTGCLGWEWSSELMIIARHASLSSSTRKNKNKNKQTENKKSQKQSGIVGHISNSRTKEGGSRSIKIQVQRQNRLHGIQSLKKKKKKLIYTGKLTRLSAYKDLGQVSTTVCNPPSAMIWHVLSLEASMGSYTHSTKHTYMLS